MSVTSTERRSRWIPWVFVGAMLLVVAVNAVLVVASLTTFTGVAVSRPYERGRGYEAVLAAAARQDALGWSVEITLAEGAVLVTARDREGRPLAGDVEGLLQRPAAADSVPLAWFAVAPGRWAAPVVGAGRGQYDAKVSLTGADGSVFELRQRLLLP